MKLDDLYKIDKDFGDPRLVSLRKLLSPITWSWSSSVSSRQNMVIQRHKEVNAAKPFMNEVELKLTSEWKVKEAHSGLWD